MVVFDSSRSGHGFINGQPSVSGKSLTTSRFFNVAEAVPSCHCHPNLSAVGFFKWTHCDRIYIPLMWYTNFGILRDDHAIGKLDGTVPDTVSGVFRKNFRNISE